MLGIRRLSWGVLAFVSIIVTSVAFAADVQVDQARGADQRVVYRELQKFGPWDDRNYQLTRDDLKLLADNEADLYIPIPAFFRVELRREFPHLSRKGPVQYPRAAVPMFQNRYGGLMRDGKIQGRGGEAERVPVPVNSEVQLNQVLGANEITVEINHANPSLVIAGSNNNGGQEMYYSTNGGDTWTIQGTLPNTCCDPTVGWSSDGSIAYVGALSGPIGVSFWRSFDGGQTWVDRFDLTNSGSDKEWLHVDVSSSSPYIDNIYMTYHNGNTMQFGRSQDFGATWDINAFPGAPSGIGSDITTDNAGNIYYAYGAFGDREIVLLKSTNGGDSFLPPITIADTNASFDWPVPSMESRRSWIYATIDADRSGGAFEGSIYAAWTDTIAPDNDGNPNANHNQVHVAFSRDGGLTWQESIPHETDDVLSVDRYNQWMTVDENGVVHVVYYDTRNSPNRTEVDLYYTFSLDGAVTWNEPVRVSSETSANLTDGQEWGDYNGISVLGDRIITTWTDNRDGPPNRKDVFAAGLTNVAAGPNFILSGADLSQQVCRPDDLEDIVLDVGQVLDFDGPVSLSYNNLPAGFSGSFSNNPVTPATPPGQSLASVSVDGSVAAGDYGFQIQGMATGVDSRELSVSVDVFDAAPVAPTLSAPADGANGESLSPTFTWSAVAQAAGYTLDVDDDPAFGSIDYTVTVPDTSHTVATNLATETTYYWRVTPANLCGSGGSSSTFSFTTASLICSAPGLDIPDGQPQTGVADTLEVFDTGTLVDLDVSIRITHTWVGDLRVILTHEGGGQTLLIDRPGQAGSGFGCDGNDIDATLDDEATTPIEDECGAGVPTLNGSFQPNGSLAVFDGQDLSGTWTIRVTDNAGQDLGTLDEWCLVPALDAPPADTDSDGVLDTADNCVLVENADQRDVDGDGIGSICDTDFNNDCIVNFLDLGELKSMFFTADPNTDVNGDGSVNFLDLGAVKEAFFTPPGPSGVPNVCDE